MTEADFGFKGLTGKAGNVQANSVTAQVQLSRAACSLNISQLITSVYKPDYEEN
jgi:hypothetical protein